MSKSIFLDAPNLSDIEKQYIAKVIDSGFVSTVGPFVSEFENKFAEYLNVEKAVSTQSGTAALHIALYELNIGKDDEVIVPALTFVATVNPVLYVGAKPVIVDVDPVTWTIDLNAVKKAITPKTKAIIPVHLYGNPCNMDEICDIADRYNLHVIEDATESLGAIYKGRQTGTFGDFGCFSFNGNKLITTGGGGMVTGRDIKKLDHIKFLVNQARQESKGYYHPEVGFNYRMTNIAASLGLGQMERLNGFLAQKKEFNRIYRQELEDIDGIVFQGEYEGAESSCWLTCVIFKDDINITELQKKLTDKSIPTRRIFMPVVEFPPYKTYRNSDYENAYSIYERGLCFPSSTLNSEDDIYYVCKILRELI
ncbi:MAG: LegC family aminotransferase [Phycisphaerae bacterium]|jgi:perosamine synthetase